MKRIVVVCEGYHDRSFWSGWLASLECRDCRKHAPEGYRTHYDPHTRDKIAAGLFGFWSPADDWVLIVHADGDRDKVNAVASHHLRCTASGFDALEIVVNLDSDVEAGSGHDPAAAHHSSVLKKVRDIDPNATLGDGVIALTNGTTRVHPVIWWTPDPPRPGLPNKQSLERLVCVAIIEAYPERAGEVQTWLDNRSDPPEPGTKEHAWSYMAGWFASHGCDDFWREVWRNDKIRTALLKRLEEIGAAPTVRSILRLPAATP